MEFLLFIIFFLFFYLLLGLLSHYYILFSNPDRTSFERNELLDLAHILPKQAISVFEAHGNLQYGILVFFGMSFFSYLWVLLGGLFGSFHYADEPAPYFFHSVVLPAIVAFGLPALKNYVGSGFSKSHPVYKILSQEIPALAGSSVTLLASAFASYGAYHEMMFFIIFINAVFIIALYLFKEKQVRERHQYNEEEYSEVSDENEDYNFDEEPRY